MTIADTPAARHVLTMIAFSWSANVQHAARSTATLLVSAFLFATAGPLSAQQEQTLSFADLMQVRQIEQPSISADGAWIAFTAEPDRGDPAVSVQSTSGTAEWSVPLASHPVIANTGEWVVMRLNASLEVSETSDDAPRRGMVVLSTADGSIETVPDVRAFAFSADGMWLLSHRYAPEGGESDEEPGRPSGTDLVIRELSSASEITISSVRGFSLEGERLAYWVAGPDAADNGLYVHTLGESDDQMVHANPMGYYAALTWNAEGSLGFVAATEDTEGESTGASVMIWDDGDVTTAVSGQDVPIGWTLPADNNLEWSADGERLFFGWRPVRPDETEEAPEADGSFDPYDLDAILGGRGVDVWHWMDDRIQPQQKVLWDREKDRTFRAVHHVDSGLNVRLADPLVPDISVSGTSRTALASSDVPYRRDALWAGGQRDLYSVDLSTGLRKPVANALRSNGELSPDGHFIAYYRDGDYYLHDVRSGGTRNVTSALGVPIANEDHDFPQPASGYGIGGWVEGDEAVVIYDKYDIWVIPTDGTDGWSLTDGAGRAEKRVFRIIDTDPDRDAIDRDGTLLLSSYHDLKKNYGFWRAQADQSGATPLLEEDRRFRYLSQADAADQVLFTREAYSEFPNLWVADSNFEGARQVTDVNPQMTDFGWGTAELAEWTSLDGTPLQGVVIKPGNYEEGKRYPVVVYYYRFMSDRLHAFNDPSINHRPSFPIYASDGYVVFLPDVRFEVGRPGLSSTKSVVPGVQHLIDIGLADPDRIALHGHSWSGYQTAFMVTQTNIFATAIAGAPVGNMTSAYSGIRLGSGRARQFQYENGQSRLSGNLWDARAEYIDNSPIFFADKVETPMLILHGDEDDAVPWEQSIELFLALKRLDKETVLLQYRGEPHHPQRYANKLDWAVKMKEWIDHYLKDAPAPEWMKNGLQYQGR